MTAFSFFWIADIFFEANLGYHPDTIARIHQVVDYKTGTSPCLDRDMHVTSLAEIYSSSCISNLMHDAVSPRSRDPFEGLRS